VAAGTELDDDLDVSILDGLAVAARGDVLLVVWREQATLASGRYLSDRIRQLAALNRTIIIMQLILPTAAPPHGETAEQGQRVLEELAPRMRTFISVPLGDPARFGVARTAMRSLFRPTGQPTLQQVARDLPAALDLVDRYRSPSTPPAATMRRTFDRMFAGLGVTRPYS
jgi:hypothetical protein